MRKQFLNLFALVLGLSVLFTSCGKDEAETATNQTVSGKVTYVDGNAAGAVVYVYLDQANNSGAYDYAVVANATGDYSVSLPAGSHFLDARFDTKNMNNADKLMMNMVFKSAGNAVTVADAAVTQNIVCANTVDNGTAKIDTSWTFDQTHSVCGFEFAYDEFNDVFTGRFDDYNIDVNFDATNPTATTISAWVFLPSVNTSSFENRLDNPTGRGRDGANGCLMGSSSFGVTFASKDTFVVNGDTAILNDPASADSLTAYAHFVSTSCVEYANGYKATGTLTFKGATSTVDLYFTYDDGYHSDSKLKTYTSFYGEFDFDAAGDHGVASGHLGAAIVTVRVTAQFNKADAVK